MFKKLYRLALVITILFSVKQAFSQQDVEFHLNVKLLPGKKILKVKRDFYDPYVWVLAQNNEVYRVNSLTMAVDDYTGVFSAYSHLQFVDIAGRSRDTVFIATNSTNVIHYKNGSIRLIGTGDGIPGTVNSVGIAESLVFNPQKSTSTVMIATNKGFRLYNSDKETITASIDTGNSRVYEATYRTEMYKDSSDITADFVTQDTIQYQPAVMKPGDGSTAIGFLWEGGKSFGYNINTAVQIYDSVYGYNLVFSNYFWGNSRGMFQNYWNYSFYSIYYPGGHYLDGINVNKITNIYGLTSFGNGYQDSEHGLIKQNLLIGTDKGFYFSSSLYTGGDDPLRKFSLFHDDKLGNIVINDICVDVVATSEPVCENGVWLAANDGLYYLKPDYGKYLGSQQLKAIRFQNLPDTLSGLNVCSGTAALAVINTFGVKTAGSYQWYKNGSELPGESRDTLTIKTTGDYYAVLYDPCAGIHLESNHLKVNVISGPVFSFNYPDKMQQCNSKPDTLKTDYSPNYHYRWYTNGALNGDTTSQYIVSQTGKYKVEVSACTNSWVTSKEVEVDLINLPFPQIMANKSNYCAGDMASLSVNIPVDTNYTINWYRDGILLPIDRNFVTIRDTTPGNYSVMVKSNIFNCSQTAQPLQVAFTPSPVFTFNYPDELQYCKGTALALTAVGSTNYQYRWYKEGTLTGDLSAVLSVSQAGKYKVEVSACPGSWVPSKEVQVDFIQLAIPIITTDKPAYCIGDNATFSVNILPNQSSTINWYKDNTLLAANSNKTTLVTNLAGIYAVSIVNNTANSDGTTCSQISAVQSLSFNPPPTVSIVETVKTSLCDGQAVDLAAHYAGGSVKWSTGETSDNITVNKSGNYKLTVTSPAGCQADTSINVSFLANPAFILKDTTICTFKHQSIMLTAPSGFSQYTWNGGTGQQTYLVSQPQKLRLTVTDANGCQATQDIKIVEQCPEIYIPNAFTPNHDGINDTWAIAGLENDQTAEVQVMNRYGIRIFKSKGYNTPWDGKYGNQKIAAGVYYYIISAKNNTQKFSGAVTIIY
jgi:gliding motility-associated-like protein